MTGRSARRLAWKARGLLALGLAMMLAALASGAAGHGLAGFVLVTAGFVAARLLARPWLLTRLAQPGGAQALSRDIAGQVLLVLVLFWMGVGFAALTGWRPDLPLWLPPVACLGAGALSRAIWRPMPPEMDRFLDEATETLTRMADSLAEDGSGDDARAEAAAAAMMVALDALPASGVPHHSIGDAALPPMADMPFWTYTNLLFDRARAHETDRDIRALVIGITDPFIATKAAGQEDLDAAFDLVAAHGGEQALYCFEMQTVALLDVFPDAWRDMPAPERLRDFAGSLSGQIADRYRDLAALVERLQQKAEST
ncbi:MAG: hypothetical protein ACK4S2_00045 [Gemmobacter sp.]|uniref:hypothetical protein n=1 Tax=Gemmobacter sp. TaxID=1898957 RepID=UPI00391CCC0D